jgi:predicted nucleic acid-binding protein
MILAASNIVIYVTSGQYPDLTQWFLDNAPSISAVTLVEVLGYHKLKATERQELERFFSKLNIIYPSEEVFQQAIELRQQHAMSLGEALIAATALHHDLSLATHNVTDFNWIKSLKVIDPR